MSRMDNILNEDRFTENETNLEEQFIDDARYEEIDSRNEEKGKELQEAFNTIRDNLSYNEFNSLRKDMSENKISNADILNMARKFK